MRAPDTATLLTLADLIGGVRGELGLHTSSIGTGAVDAMTVEPTPATLAYTDFLLAVAAIDHRLERVFSRRPEAPTAKPHGTMLSKRARGSTTKIAYALEQLA